MSILQSIIQSLKMGEIHLGHPRISHKLTGGCRIDITFRFTTCSSDFFYKMDVIFFSFPIFEYHENIGCGIIAVLENEYGSTGCDILEPIQNWKYQQVILS